MFHCQNCGKVSKPREKTIPVVLERHEHVFPFREAVNRFHRAGKTETRDDNGGTGMQITKEIRVGSCCADKFKEKP